MSLLVTIFSAEIVLIGLPLLALAILAAKWLPRQVITCRANDALAPAQTAVAANLLASLWMALLGLTYFIAEAMGSQPTDADGPNFGIGYHAVLVMMVCGVFFAVTLVPLVVAALTIPAVCLFQKPAEWIVARCSADNSKSEAAAMMSTLLTLLSATLLSLGLILLTLLDTGQTHRYLPLQLALAPFSLVAWLAARVISLQRAA